MKISYSTRIIDTSILKLFHGGNYEPIYVCGKYVITFGKRKILLDSKTQLMLTDTREKYPIENTKMQQMF